MSVRPGRAGRREPTAADPHRPFCSARCADVDLGRWFRESYRIPSNEPAPDLPDGEPAGSPDKDRREH